MANSAESEIEGRLRSDASRIDADVSSQLHERIAASVHSAKQVRSIALPERRSDSHWWASGLTGIAAALLIIAFINWNRDTTNGVAESTIATTITPEISERFGSFPLKAQTADLTGPLEEELLKLQSDLEKAREAVERDLRSTL
jgi:hypothetical protein